MNWLEAVMGCGSAGFEWNHGKIWKAFCLRSTTPFCCSLWLRLELCSRFSNRSVRGISTAHPRKLLRQNTLALGQCWNGHHDQNVHDTKTYNILCIFHLYNSLQIPYTSIYRIDHIVYPLQWNHASLSHSHESCQISTPHEWFQYLGVTLTVDHSGNNPEIESYRYRHVDILGPIQYMDHHYVISYPWWIVLFVSR